MTDPCITVLVENTAGGRGLIAEHGLSFLIDTGRNKILFDTGQGLALRYNVDQLRIDLKTVDAVVLSHGHYDHTGGLAFALNRMNSPRVYAHPQAFNPKYARNPDGTGREIGIAARDKITAGELAKVVSVENKTEISPGFYLTGPIPRTTDFEDTGGAFFKDPECRIPDDLPDDQAAFIETKDGTVVILGCAHSGVINTLRYIHSLTGSRPIHTVIGGMHLLNASQTRMDQTIAELRRFNIRQLFPCHCTGFAATVRLWKEFPEKCNPCPAGTVLMF
ncbi:MAG: MBL fold metallo-hydrolase [Pontiellaceae bacterium]|jgi:7,8-dihydropterin-6-yl-methyl-4-(beta-D-ribofuranosyl)aminobenzene 5'-phosphate synthase|nr:MBL fold metallo-hydrolase [Pontiellaceae bacterium]